MNVPDYQPGFFEKALIRVLPEIAKHIDPACRNSYFNYTPFSDELPVVEVEGEQRQAYGKIEGMGRVYDLYCNQTGIIEVTFAHGKFASRVAEGCVQHEWLAAREIAAPIISAPSQKICDEFLANSLFVALHPFKNNDQIVRPALKKNQLVRYRILTLDEPGTEGVAVALAPP